MSQRRVTNPEENTVETATIARDLSGVACCTPVSFAWAVEPEGKAAVMVGFRHTGYLCAGDFVQMPFNRWKRARFEPARTATLRGHR